VEHRIMGIELAPFVKSVVATLVYCLIGIAMFGIGFLIMNAVSPFSIRKEIEEDHNTALAIVIAAVILGISMIVAAAVGG
jgi:putative membrane protein